jgi:hypothetical protein
MPKIPTQMHEDPIYVAGEIYGDFTVVSLTSNGHQRWTNRYNGSFNAWDVASSVVYGEDGNIYAAGWLIDINTYWDFTIRSFTLNGNERWMYSYHGSTTGQGVDFANAIVNGLDGNIYAAGYSSNINTNGDFTIISLTPNGNQRWVYCYSSPGTGQLDDEASSIVYGEDGNIYAAGHTWGDTTYRDFTVISLNPVIGIKEESPNPISLFTVSNLGRKIEFSLSLSKSAIVAVSLYNLIGEKVLSFSVQVTKGTSNYQKDLSFLPSGVYILKADLDGRSITKKCIVLK